MELVVNLLPHAALATFGKVMKDRSIRRQVVRQVPPGAAGAQQIEDGVHHLAHVGLERVRQCFGAGGTSGARIAHCWSVKSVG